MLRSKISAYSSVPVSDDDRLFVSRRDYSGGINTRQHPQQINENQATVLENVDIETPGQRQKRLGSYTVGDDVSNDACGAMHSFRINGATDQMLMLEDTTLWKRTDETTNWASLKADFTASDNPAIFTIKESGVSPDDIAVVQTGVDNAFRFLSDGTAQDLGSTTGTGSDSPPRSLVNAWYNNRWWVLKNSLLYWSAAYSADYSTAFDDVTDFFRIPVGDERAIIPTRDLGMVIFGKQGVWALQPSVTPAATDQPVPIGDIGCVAGNTVVAIADDIYWLAPDGVRALKRTEQDKLQLHSSNAISYPNKAEYDLINWAKIELSRAVYFDNKYFLALPTSSSTTNNKVWVYHPATDGWSTITGWNVGSWAKHQISGEERLYYSDGTNGQTYRVLSGYADDGVAVSYTEEGREEDFGQPMVWKKGGTVEVEAIGSGGTYNLTVYASIDGGAYSQLGTLTLSSASAVSLPATLPFTLGGDSTLRGKFQLDNLGRFRTLKIKITNTDTNSSYIKIFGHNITTYPEEYQNE